MALLKLFFATDIHGSTACFRKFINAATRPDGPKVLILGGDISGKFVVPEVEQAHGRCRLPLPSGDLILEPDERLAAEERLADAGCYIYRCDETEYKKYRFDGARRKAVAETLQVDRLKEWLSFMDERLVHTETKVVINCGNDDAFFLDSVLKDHPSVWFPEGQILSLDEGLTLASVGYSTPTPWHCPRELPEDELKGRISETLSSVSDVSRCIFNFHCPPKGTSLDLAPRLDATLRPVVGLNGVEMEHVGSTAVREAIEEFQPLLSLHGHIHEQHRIETLQQTPCVNPGSSYWTGMVQGALATFRGGVLAGLQLTTERTSPRALATQKDLFRSLLKLTGIGRVVEPALDRKEPSNAELAQKLDQLSSQLALTYTAGRKFDDSESAKTQNPTNERDI